MGKNERKSPDPRVGTASSEMATVRDNYVGLLRTRGVHGLLRYLIARHETGDEPLQTAVVVFPALHAWCGAQGGTRDEKRERMRQALRDFTQLWELDEGKSPITKAYRVALELLEGAVVQFSQPDTTERTPWRYELCRVCVQLARYALYGHMADPDAPNDVRGGSDYGKRLEELVVEAISGIRERLNDCRDQVGYLSHVLTQARQYKRTCAVPRAIPPSVDGDVLRLARDRGAMPVIASSRLPLPKVAGAN